MKEETRQRRAVPGFHAVTTLLRHRPEDVVELYVDRQRQDARMRSLLERAQLAGVRAVPVDSARLDAIAGGGRHQGVVAFVAAQARTRSLEEVLDALDPTRPALFLVLDGVQDPHNLGACLRVADGAGVDAVIAPKDRAAGLSAAAVKVASGAADTVPYVTVTNLARALRTLKEAGVWVVGASGEAQKSLYECDLAGPVAWVLGAEGEGLRRLTRELCDELVRIPMLGAVESLNVSVAAGVCLYETVRRRLAQDSGG
jgi:23S rRNA (guanosine2251-2'-O)-methyltransferase